MLVSVRSNFHSKHEHKWRIKVNNVVSKTNGGGGKEGVYEQ